MDLRARFRLLPLLLLLTLALEAPPLAADRVVLKNGQTFEDVIATDTGAQVRIQLASGELRLSKAQVASIEKATTPYQAFLDQKADLEADPSTPARAWVELARWAGAKGLRREAREAALAAAELDPKAEGLAAFLSSQGYVFDAELGRYLAEGEYLSRRGFVEHRGEWVTRDERQRRLEQARAAEEERRLARLERFRRQEFEGDEPAVRAPQPPAPTVVVVAPIAYFPAPFFILPSPVPGGLPPAPAGRVPQPKLHQGPVMDLLERAPGSLIPGFLDLDPG